MAKNKSGTEKYEDDLIAQFSQLRTSGGRGDDTKIQVATASLGTSPTYVYFDLETTGLSSHRDQIVQISAICGESKFNQYVVPTCKIHPEASKVTKLTMQDGKLHHNNKPVPTLYIRQALASFIRWLREHHQPILLGHNAKKFDCRFLVNALERMNLREEFSKVITGFADTLLVFREYLPERRKEKKSFKQEILVRELLGEEYGAHDASEDVRALQLLVNKLKIPRGLIEEHLFSVDSIQEVLRRQKPGEISAESSLLE